MGRRPLPGGLVEHLRDAVALNRSRRAGYCERGGIRAEALSRALVAAERALLPIATVLDRQAAPFVARGIPILVGDLAPLSDAPPADRPVVVGAGAPVSLDLAGPLGEARRALEADDLGAAAADLGRALAYIHRAEGGGEGVSGPACHFALAAHVVESAGWMAQRGVEHAERSGGETLALSRRLVRGHLALLPSAVRLDRGARPLHALGVGLFVNDLPPIPFPAAHG